MASCVMLLLIRFYVNYSTACFLLFSCLSLPVFQRSVFLSFRVSVVLMGLVAWN